MHTAIAAELIELTSDDERSGPHNVHGLTSLRPGLIGIAQLRADCPDCDVDGLLCLNYGSRELGGWSPATAAVLGRGKKVSPVVLDLREHESADAAAGLEQRISALARSGDGRTSDELLEAAQVP